MLDGAEVVAGRVVEAVTGGDPSVVSAGARKGDRMRTLRLPVGALLVALMLGAVLAVGASATPVAALWDISAESVQDAPSYLVKRVEGNFFVSGELVGTFDTSVGSKTGFGEPLTCAFEVHRNGFDVYGTLQLVRL
jgi:hypothetical protein